jgi:hypothetical protein
MHSCPRHAQRYELVGGLAPDVTRPELCVGTDPPHRPVALIASVVLEIRRDTYLDEASGAPHDRFARIRTFVERVFARLTAR